METTIKEIAKIAVSGLQKDYLSEKEQAKLVDYLLSWSSLSVSDVEFIMLSASKFGVGKGNDDRELEMPKLMTFFWGEYDNEFDSMNGLPSRTWCLKSHPTLARLEYHIVAELVGVYNNLGGGEIIAIINGKVERYRLTRVDSQIVPQFRVEWLNIQPYSIMYTEEVNQISNVKTEYFNSIVEVEKKIKQLVTKGTKEIKVFDDIDAKLMKFEVSQILYDSETLEKRGELEVLWSIWGIEEDF